MHSGAKHMQQLRSCAPVEVVVHKLELAQLWDGTV